MLNEQDFSKISKKLTDDTDDEYKEALRKHVIFISLLVSTFSFSK